MKQGVKISLLIGAVLIVAGIALFIDTPTLHAVTYSIQNGINAARGDGQVADLFGNTGVITKATNILLFVVGALAVIMLIIGGLRYTISGGNSSAVTAAKNTILYAIVGLVISFLAYAIVNFILSSLTGTGTTGTNV